MSGWVTAPTFGFELPADTEVMVELRSIVDQYEAAEDERARMAAAWENDRRARVAHICASYWRRLMDVLDGKASATFGDAEVVRILTKEAAATVRAKRKAGRL